MCKEVLKKIDEDKRLGLKKGLRLVTDMLGWVPTYIQGLIGAITG